ncbi:MAG: STAS domain-containing protein [Acidobacteria bacterium]|nr:STAS domain-containing protein [Acidobacteriota bacterium]
MFTPKLVSELKTYSKDKAVADLFAGLTVGVVALPLAMAFAIASGLPPERGLYTAIVAGFLISALGGSKVQIGGPTGAFVVIVSAILLEHGTAGLAVATLMAGVMLILFGAFKFGGLIKFIPFPVTTGFTTGIAVVIFSTQVRDLFGLDIEHVPAEFIPKWRALVGHFSTLDATTTLLGLSTIVIVVVCRTYWPKLPAMLIGMLATTTVAVAFDLNVATIGSRFGELPRSLPGLSMPDFAWDQLPKLVNPAFTIALLAAIESLLSATVADGMIGGRHRPNIELIGQGVANIASVLFGGIPATGAIARTATNVKSGARTPVAGMIHALVLLILLLLVGPWAKLIPLSALAGILVVVAYNMSERHHFVAMLRGPRSDAFVLVLTFMLTVLVDLTVAVEVGVVLASLLFIRRMAEISHVNMITRELRGDQSFVEDPQALALKEVPPDVEVFEVNGPFFFGMIDTFKNAMRTIEKPPRVLIVRIRNVPAVDGTAIHVLTELAHRCQRDHTHLVFSGVHAQPLKAFTKAGLVSLLGPDHFKEDIDEALAFSKVLVQHIEDGQKRPLR